MKQQLEPKAPNICSGLSFFLDYCTKVLYHVSGSLHTKGGFVEKPRRRISRAEHLAIGLILLVVLSPLIVLAFIATGALFLVIIVLALLAGIVAFLAMLLIGENELAVFVREMSAEVVMNGFLKFGEIWWEFSVFIWEDITGVPEAGGK